MPTRRTSTTRIVITGANQVMLSPSEKRVAFWPWISLTTGGIYFDMKPMTAISQGIDLSYLGCLYPFKIEDIGEGIRGTWYCFGGTPGDSFVVIETLEG
jgi:hypothetical protein